jgi:Flp pilus assembly pilin Flp
MWRWNGQSWMPAGPPPAAGAGSGVGLTLGLVAGFVGIVVLVLLVVAAILYTMGGQIANVFSNVTAAMVG